MPESLGTREAPHPSPAAAPRPRWQRVLQAVLVLGAVALACIAAIMALVAPSSALPEALGAGAVVALVLVCFVATRPRREPEPEVYAEALAAQRSRRGAWGRVPRLVAWALVLGWLVTVVAVVATTERSRSLGDLESAISSGDVGVVGVSGELGPGATGYSTVELHWSNHGLRYVSEVRQVRGSTQTGGGSARVVRGDLTSYLTGLDPSLRIEQAPHTIQVSGLHFDALGWNVAGWLLWPLLALLAMTLRLVAVSPEPWRATRWAWGWIVFGLGPLGCLAYLLAGGPTGALRRPAGRGRGLTGGWAFLLVLVLGSGSFWSS